MNRRIVVGVLAVLLCLACSWSSDLIVANMSTSPLTIRAQYAYDLERNETLPIQFAPVNSMGDRKTWQPARRAAYTVDTGARVVQVTLPPRTAARIGSARTCGSPETCHNFPLTLLELSGSQGSLIAEGEVLRAAFAVESDFEWILWYPMITAHDFWANMRRPQATVLGLAVAFAVFTLWTAVVVARTQMPRRWGWAAIALLGVGELAINWTTGETSASLFAFPLPGASITRSSLAGPWMVVVSLPVGAILALLKRDSALRERDQSVASIVSTR